MSAVDDPLLTNPRGFLPLTDPRVIRALIWGTTTNTPDRMVLIPDAAPGSEPRSLPADREETAALTPTVGRDRQEEEQ